MLAGMLSGMFMHTDNRHTIAQAAASMILKQDKDRAELFALGFKLGFMVSRDGFNGECSFDHCGPPKVEAESGSVEEFMESIEKSAKFRKLRDEAVADWTNTNAAVEGGSRE